MGEEDGFIDKKKPHKAKHSGDCWKTYKKLYLIKKIQIRVNQKKLITFQELARIKKIRKNLKIYPQIAQKTLKGLPLHLLAVLSLDFVESRI